MIKHRNKRIAQHPLVSECIKNKDLFAASAGDVFIGWGYKGSGLWARKVTTSRKADYCLLEDGFIRSLFPGYKLGLPYSIVLDTSGIYYDASGDSDLIKFLNSGEVSGEQWSVNLEKADVRLALERVRSSGVSKYNCHLDQRRSFEEGVLVVDQTAGDAAIKYSGMDPSDFNRMLEDAIRENPNITIYVKAHPDHQYRKKHSCFDERLLEHESVRILPSDMPTSEALRFCETVYVGSSLLGMEALIHEKRVYTYGWNFYAGWGLTEDRAGSPKPPRNREITLEKLFEASYLRYTQYFDPDTFERCDIHRVIDHIELQWKEWRKGTGDWLTFGMSPWKKKLLPIYLGPKCGSISHNAEQGIEGNDFRVITWGAKSVASSHRVDSLTRVEDGFIRSRGLGANFNFPLSWVFDDLGIYFDSRSQSRLEWILEHHEFTSKELEQADELLDFLKINKLTKYNLGIKEVVLPVESKGKKVILIPGQVDSDASIAFGSPSIRDNKGLLAEVRAQNPEAFICYKPHPDLLSGARKDAPLWKGIERDVDYIVTEGDIISWIQAVEEVHTLTSTVGFEALIHGKPVYTYGLPFYAGWGVTKDWLLCKRRSSERSLSELVCAALILYPTYLNPRTREFTSAINAAKLLTDPGFKYDSRSIYLKILGEAKSCFYKIINLVKK